MKYQGTYSFKVRYQSITTSFNLIIPTLQSTEPILGIARGVKIIVAEIPQNEGMTVINAAEHIAIQIVREFDIDHSKLVYIERYPTTESVEYIGDWSEVKFHNANCKDPYWRCLNLAEIQGVLSFIDAYTEQ